MPADVTPAQPLLEAVDVTLRFGGVHALQDVSLRVDEGAIHAIIGPNGAGKTSLLNCMSGLYRNDSGVIRIRGVETTGLRQREIFRLGVARTFQHLAVVGELTVLENLRLGAVHELAPGIFSNALRLPYQRRRSRLVDERATEVIDSLGLAQHRHKAAGELSYGLQKRVEIGRALMSLPTLLLLDEPMAGMTIDEKHELADVIVAARERTPFTVALIEHDVGIVMRLASTITVLNFGRVIAAGPPAAVREQPEVIAAYLGDQTTEPTTIPGT